MRDSTFLNGTNNGGDAPALRSGDTADEGD